MSKWLEGIKDAELFVEINKGIGNRTKRKLFIKINGKGFFSVNYDYMEGFYDYMDHYLNVLGELK